MRRNFGALVMVIMGSPWCLSPALALNVQTHDLINRAAAVSSQADPILKSSLGLIRGLGTPFSGRNNTTDRGGQVNTALDWIGEGGIREDDSLRFLRHFHDPLRPWDSAGLRLALLQFDSSIHWMQGNDQGFAWQDARRHFHTALRATTRAARDQAFADAFRALGQVMHLAVDASVPEHVRNDIHPLEGLCRTVGLRCYGNYEYWVSDQHGQPGSAAEAAFIARFLSNPIGFDPSVLRIPTGSARAPVPVARVIDADRYSGSDPGVTLNPVIGIAEFANANFFSENTLRGQYPFPHVNGLVASQRAAPRSGRVRAYYAKGFGDGLPLDPVLAQCVLDRPSQEQGIFDGPTYACVDEAVWEQIAQAMLPRAVGYARGLLDYFFRGKIEIAAPQRFVYGLAPYLDGNAGSFTKLRFKVRNATEDPNENTIGSGEMVAVVQYRKPVNATQDLTQNPFAEITLDLFFAVSKPQAVTLTREFQELAFDFSQSPIPANAADLFLTVVYRGQLGLEEGAVLVGGKDLFEPDPLDVANSTDYDCFAGTLFQVSNFDLFPPYNPSRGQTQRDVDQDGIQDLFGPFIDRGLFVKTFDLSQAPPTPSESQFDFAVVEQSFAQTSRLMLLQDQPFYGFSWLIRDSVEIPSGASFPSRLFVFVSRAVQNQVFLGSDRELRRRITPPFFFRGLITFHIGFSVFDPRRFTSCLANLPFVTPSLTRVQGSLPAE